MKGFIAFLFTELWIDKRLPKWHCRCCQYMSELCQAHSPRGRPVVRALACVTNVLGSNSGLNTLYSVLKKAINFDLELQRI